MGEIIEKYALSVCNVKLTWTKNTKSVEQVSILIAILHTLTSFLEVLRIRRCIRYCNISFVAETIATL